MFGVGAGALGLGALGLAFAAVEHWSKQKTESAREVYLASLMAIDVDTPAEIRYLARLAERMGLDDHAVAELEATLEDD